MKLKKITPSKVNVGKILFTLSTSKYLSPYQTWYPPLKSLSNKIIFFDTHWNRILYGREKMNEMFLKFIENEKPNYIHMCFGADEFDLGTFVKIREISPKTKIIGFFGDDDLEFEKYSRYLMLFLDYGFIGQYKYVPKYKKEGIKNVFGVPGFNTEIFKPMNMKKKYDVTFIGTPLTEKSGRYNFIKFLKEKGIPITLFGWGWEKYPDLKEIYLGPLSNEQMVKVINQSKINLCFSKNSYGQSHLKGKVLEGGACKTFVLTEYYEDYVHMFNEGKEIIMFEGKEDLHKKISYFLKNENERQKIANAAYAKIIEKYNLEKDLKKIFSKIKYEKRRWKLPNIPEKSYIISKKEIFNKDNLKEILKDYDYISFKEGGASHLKFKDFLQIYSLKITNKPISCCNYYVYRKGLGDYLYFCSEKSFRELDKKDFVSFLNLSQLLVTKEFFLENIEKFKKAFQREIDFLNKDNTAFVGFPLLRVKKIPTKKYSIMKKAFVFEFFHQLYSLYYTKKIFFKPYVPFLLLEIFFGKFFILKYLFDSLKDRSRISKLKNYQISSNS